MPAAAKPPNGFTSLSQTLLQLLQKPQSLDHLKQIHSLIITCGLSQHYTLSLTNNLLHSLKSSPTTPTSLTYTSLLFDQIQEPNDTSLWNTIIQSFPKSSQSHHVAILCFRRMRRVGVVPNQHTFPLLLKVVSEPNSQYPFQFYSQIVKFGLGFDTFVRNSLVSAFANCGFVGFARRVFDESMHKDLVSWTAMIDGYVRNGQAIDALQCFLDMRVMGVEPDHVTVVSVLCAAGMACNVWLGRCVHGVYVELGRVKWNVYVGCALVDMYSKCGYCDDAFKVFKEMPDRNVVCWSAMIAGFVQCSRYKDALGVFQDMLLEERVEPSLSTLTSVLTACAQLGALDEGRWVHGYIGRNKLEMNSILGTALIDMYAKCGCVDKAMLVFEKLPFKNVYTWSAMINGLATHGDASGALILFSRMLETGVRPNEVTFIGVLCACSHGGLVNEGREYFGLMRSVYGLEPNVDHYGCMVDLLGRAGQLEEALKLIHEMPMEPTPGIWGALFGSCMIHKAFDLGEQIGKYLVKLQPHKSGRYSLLANMYSSCQKWEAAARIRKLMKGNAVEKTRACSWIEVNGVVREFIAFDESHAELNDLCLILDRITEQLKLAGYIPDSNILNFDNEGISDELSAKF